MFNKAKFKAKVIENGLTMDVVAQKININTTTLYRKINGISDFYRHEIQSLCDLLKLDNPLEIFFA